MKNVQRPTIYYHWCNENWPISFGNWPIEIQKFIYLKKKTMMMILQKEIHEYSFPNKQWVSVRGSKTNSRRRYNKEETEIVFLTGLVVFCLNRISEKYPLNVMLSWTCWTTKLLLSSFRRDSFNSIWLDFS